MLRNVTTFSFTKSPTRISSNSHIRAIASKINFDDASLAYKHMSFAELARAVLVFKLCSIQPLVKRSKPLLDLSYKLLGERVTNGLMKQTMFGHFCAGESSEELMGTVKKMQGYGVNAILDYAAEDEGETTEEKKRDAKKDEEALLCDLENRSLAEEGEREESYRRYQYGEGIHEIDKTNITARTYDYYSEQKCDNNYKIFSCCIEEASKQKGGYAAIKVTALANPDILQRLSLVLNETRRLFRNLATTDKIDEISRLPSKRYLDLKISQKSFTTYLTRLGVQWSETEATKLFNQLDGDRSGFIEYIEWIDSLMPENSALRSLLFSKIVPPNVADSSAAVHPLDSLTDAEMEQFSAINRRLNLLAAQAAESKVRLLIDAEHTYFQPAIDHLAVLLQQQFNNDFPVIYNTYQCYLRDSYGRLNIDIARAKAGDYHFACKLVRGAYMYQERERAKQFRYRDPIYPTIERTHINYNRAIETIMSNFEKRHIMIASHNENSVKHTINLMHMHGIDPADQSVSFAQLLGMCDRVTYTLGAEGYNAFKYLPYGPVHEAMPYLIRRAEENSDLIASSAKDRQLLWAELKRRIVPRS